MTSALVAGLVPSAFAGLVSPANAPAQKPNIPLIIGDDIGWMQMQAYAKELCKGETPNIDRLATEGRMSTDQRASSRSSGSL